MALQERRLKKFLTRCPQGMFVTSHARFHPVLQTLLEELAFKQILLLRDPRDVAVSHAFFVKNRVLHHHHRYYTDILGTDEERIMSSIRGFGPDSFSGRRLLPIDEIYAGYLPWLENPSTLAVRFEDLIGPVGGGKVEKQAQEIERLGKFLDRPIDWEQARQIAQDMYGKNSRIELAGAAKT